MLPSGTIEVPTRIPATNNVLADSLVEDRKEHALNCLCCHVLQKKCTFLMISHLVSYLIKKQPSLLSQSSAIHTMNHQTHPPSHHHLHHPYIHKQQPHNYKRHMITSPNNPASDAMYLGPSPTSYGKVTN